MPRIPIHVTSSLFCQRPNFPEHGKLGLYEFFRVMSGFISACGFYKGPSESLGCSRSAFRLVMLGLEALGLSSSGAFGTEFGQRPCPEHRKLSPKS